MTYVSLSGGRRSHAGGDLVLRFRGAGDERTQRQNVAAFKRWGVMRGCWRAQRSATVGGAVRHPTADPSCSPHRGHRICDANGHGDLLTARAAAATGVPMIASTCRRPMEHVAAEFGETPGWFQLYPPNDFELAESFVRRAEALVHRDSGHAGHSDPCWRPRDLSIGSFPQLSGCAWPTTRPTVFRAKLKATRKMTHWALLRLAGIFVSA